jgi:hypothetical protein
VAVLAGLVLAGCASGKPQPTWCSAAQRQYNTAYSRAVAMPLQSGRNDYLLEIPRMAGAPGEPAALLHDALWAGSATWQDINNNGQSLEQVTGITRNAVDAVGALSREARKDGCTGILIHAPT